MNNYSHLSISSCSIRFPGSALDLKKSSFKKMSKFLQAYGVKGARAENLVSLKEDKFLNEMVVTRIDRSHIMYTGFRPYKPSDVSEGSTTAETSATSSTGFAVEELYRASKDLYPVLDALGVDHGRQFDAKDAGKPYSFNPDDRIPLDPCFLPLHKMVTFKAQRVVQYERVLRY